MKKHIIFAVSILFIADFLPPLAGAQGRLNSTVQSQVNEVGGGKFEIVLHAVPHKNLVPNWDGRWQLDLSEAKGASFSKVKYGKDDMRRDDMSIIVNGQRDSKASKGTKAALGSVNYRFIVFVCTSDKTMCYRDDHRGMVNF